MLKAVSCSSSAASMRQSCSPSGWALGSFTGMSEQRRRAISHRRMRTCNVLAALVRLTLILKPSGAVVSKALSKIAAKKEPAIKTYQERMRATKKEVASLSAVVEATTWQNREIGMPTMQKAVMAKERGHRGQLRAGRGCDVDERHRGRLPANLGSAGAQCSRGRRQVETRRRQAGTRSLSFAGFGSSAGMVELREQSAMWRGSRSTVPCHRAAPARGAADRRDSASCTGAARYAERGREQRPRQFAGVHR